ncbi:MAG: GNAT family N-acetyltransferase [Pseudomonadales bacterium]
MSAALKEVRQRYPRRISCGGEDIALVLLESLEPDTALAFAKQLSDHDLLSLSRDIQEPKVLSAWSKSIASGDIVSVGALRGSEKDGVGDGEIVGTTAVVTDKHSWSAHVGELRILVRPDARDLGLGRALIQESFLIGLDLGLEKLTVRMTLDQEGAIAVFEEMGFRTEALLKDHVKDRAGTKHDLLMLSHDVQAVGSMMQAYGLDEAFNQT